MIRKLRREKDITQEELAKAVGVERSTVAKWETGRSKPKADGLLKLSVALNCTVDELLKEEKTK